MVLSMPCFQPVNRAVYRELAERHGVSVHLIVPKGLMIGGQFRVTPTGEAAPYELTLLDLVRSQGRLQRFRGLAAAVANWKPTHILVDNDPASLMAWQAIRARPKATILALTAENLAPRYARDFCAQPEDIFIRKRLQS